jgi:RNA polymerase sigma-70 factor (ECF subfamily)
MPAVDPVTPVQACLNRLAAGDAAAREDLFRFVRDRLLVMVRSMLARFPAVRRFEQSDDVVQQVLIRLDRALAQIPLAMTRDFLSVAATNVRREVIDLARHYYGPQGTGANHFTPGSDGPNLEQVAEAGRDDPARLAECVELHEQIQTLPVEEREVVDLQWYVGLSQPEIADLLGFSVRTVKRRAAAALIRLRDTYARSTPK